ncbi:hypothetical protein CWI81_10820 [Idiomarina seosinensis]|uniref:Uncharacterized protein n=1 Tax=Idiomarina seosinensis TaxID=281739 RepID=A0A432ZBY4_9GAMM|nr:hypothetical protein CWI81_10820 [Idiomarina seosinensis]
MTDFATINGFAVNLYQRMLIQAVIFLTFYHKIIDSSVMLLAEKVNSGMLKVSIVVAEVGTK